MPGLIELWYRRSELDKNPTLHYCQRQEYLTNELGVGKRAPDVLTRDSRRNSSVGSFLNTGMGFQMSEMPCGRTRMRRQAALRL